MEYKKTRFSALFLLLVCAAPRLCGGDQALPALEPEGYTSSRVCAECHSDIFKAWKRSMHAMSAQDPIFDTAYMQAMKMAPNRAKRLCLTCHAPVTMENGDYDLREGVTLEGVTCDFCHSVKDVVADGTMMRYQSEVGKVKRSVLRHAESPAHEVAYSELHSQARFCGGCHLYRTGDGVALMGTYEEWLNGPYAKEGKPCQACHMPRSKGHVVREGVKKTPEGVHLHELIHDTEQLKSAVTVKVEDVKTTDGHIKVVVSISNFGSGHMVPTGIPSRELDLVVTITDPDGKTATSKRVYKKTIADKDGNILEDDHEILLRGETIVSDNRIGPKEKRREEFLFPMTSAGPFEISADAVYRYAPYVIDRRLMEITMSSATESFKP